MKIITKFLVTSLAVAGIANAQGDLKKISAKDLPARDEWQYVSYTGRKTCRSIVDGWKRNNVEVLKVLVPAGESWHSLRDERGRPTDVKNLNYGVVYRGENGQVYYTTGLVAVNNNRLRGDTAETVGSLPLKPEYIVEGFDVKVDTSTLKKISKFELPGKKKDKAAETSPYVYQQKKWETSPEANNAFMCLRTAWKKKGIEVLEFFSDAEGWEQLRDKDNELTSSYSVTYSMAYKDGSGPVFYATGLTAVGFSGDGYFKDADLIQEEVVPSAIVYNYEPKKYSVAELDTMTSLTMDDFPKCEFVNPTIYDNIHGFARYNITDDVIKVVLHKDWEKDPATGKEIMNFDMVHKRADGKVVYTYGYTVDRESVKDYAKAKVVKIKDHQIVITDWDEDRFFDEAAMHEALLARRTPAIKKAELPKDGWKDAGVNKALLNLAKKEYPTIKKVIIRSPGYQYKKNWLGAITDRYVEYDIVYVSKTNVITKTVYKPGFVASQSYNGKTYDKNWVSYGIPATSVQPISDWK